MAIWQPGDEITADRLNSVPYGLDADKPANPVVGQIYLATDTGKLYRCYANGVWTPDFFTETVCEVSDNVRNSNDEEKCAGSTGVYVKVKEIKLNEDLPACRVKYDLRATGSSPAGGYICKNGEQIGEWHRADDYQTITVSEDFTDFKKDDLIQIYITRLNYDGGSACAKNMKLCYDYYDQITQIKGKDLDTPIRFAFKTISTTNQDP